MPRSLSPSSMAARQSGALASTAAEDRPSPTTSWMGFPLGSRARMALFSSSKHRPRSGLVRYSSLSAHRVWTAVMPWLTAKSSGTWLNTVSWAAAWSARKRSMVRVLYRAPALPQPSLAGVFSFMSANRSLFSGSSVRYSRRRSSLVTSGTNSPGSAVSFCVGPGTAAW